MSRLDDLKKFVQDKTTGEMCEHLAECWKAEEYKKVKTMIITAPEELQNILRRGVADLIPDEGKKAAFFNYINYEEKKQ